MAELFSRRQGDFGDCRWSVARGGERTKLDWVFWGKEGICLREIIRVIDCFNPFYYSVAAKLRIYVKAIPIPFVRESPIYIPTNSGIYRRPRIIKTSRARSR